jgi:hypothetical protein
MSYDKEWLKKHFPNLIREIEEGSEYVNVREIIVDPLKGYVPGPRDYLARAKTVDEAEEVISYLEQVGEINSNEANALRNELKEKGLKAFGEKRELGYYYKLANRLRIDKVKRKKID